MLLLDNCPKHPQKSDGFTLLWCHNQQLEVNSEAAAVEGTTADSLVQKGLNTQWLQHLGFGVGAEGPSLPGGSSCLSLATVQDQNSKKQLLKGIFFLIYNTQETESTMLL